MHPADKHADARIRTSWSYTPLKSTGENIQIWNNAHTIQVQWTGTYPSDVKIQVVDSESKCHRMHVSCFMLLFIIYVLHINRHTSWQC